MGIITALTNQKRNPNRINVYIDDEFAFGLAAITAVSLRVGQTVTAAEINTLQKADQLEKAKQSAIRFITYRPRSTAEVQQNLQKKGFNDDVIAQAVTRLEEADLLDDAAFARFWVEQRETFKPRSHFALRQELRQKGVSEYMIDNILTSVDETAAARRAAQKKLYHWQKLPQNEFSAKLGAYLQRRGFSYSIIRDVLDEMWQTVSSSTTQTD
ncbi:MAG: hypothetical protein GY796_18370 [Chloroflexi bacterium]|nr:hypothetical protein [Chloroflexota bacterium]